MKSSVQNPSLIPWLLIECKFFCACVQATHETALHIKDAFVIAGAPPRGSAVKSLPALQAASLGRADPWRRKWQHSYSPHGQRSLVGLSVSGLKKSDVTEVTELSLVMEPATVLACVNLLPTEWKNRLKTRRTKCFLEKFRLYRRPAYTVKS